MGSGDHLSDYEKYCKFFSMRMVQTLVQARLGDHVESKCMNSTDSTTVDWFNIKVDELGEVAAYLKSNVKTYPPAGKLCVEFLLYTPSGQFLPLEAWVLSANKISDDSRSVSDIYHQLSTLLRSVAVCSRMTPIHRLYVRKQNQEAFIIMYRVYEGDKTSDMGKGSKKRRVGELISEHGSVKLDLHYRTSMHFDEPELAPEPLEIEKENKEKERKEARRSSVPSRPSLADCVPITGTKTDENRTSPCSIPSTTCVGSAQSIRGTPKFILGQSNSSEDSRNSEVPHSMEDSHRPIRTDLRNHSFPFVNLLQSAYNPSNGTRKNNSAASNLNQSISTSPTTETSTEKEKVLESLKTEKIEEVIEEEDEQSEDEDLKQMEYSEDSFVDFLQSGDFGHSDSPNGELRELIRQLRIAPDMSPSSMLNISQIDISEEIDKWSSQKEDFSAFLNHINSIVDDE